MGLSFAPEKSGQAVGFTGCVKTRILIAVGFIQRVEDNKDKWALALKISLLG